MKNLDRSQVVTNFKIMNMNIRLFILAAISFGCGLSFQYTNVIEFDDYYTLSLTEVRNRMLRSATTTPYGENAGAHVANNLRIANQFYDLPLSAFEAEKYMSKGRKNAVTVAYALGGISLIGGILITGLNKEKT